MLVLILGFLFWYILICLGLKFLGSTGRYLVQFKIHDLGQHDNNLQGANSLVTDTACSMIRVLSGDSIPWACGL
jgi:hypothetical protein